MVVRVKPGSKKGPLVEVGDDSALTIYVQERAVDGKANEAVTKLLAAHLGVPRRRVELISGATARLKRFRIT
ncbi:PE-PGRS family protein [Mycolicibacterium mageritense DSM 44476 = CIP 104973]|nr:PE-PGRS family protein [Mycolicibacterium mageritense DSM 44476 = CIP 104973]